MNVSLIGSLILLLALRRERASVEIQQSIYKLNITEDGHDLRRVRGVLNNRKGAQYI